jgi:hypothetical protein
MKHLHSKYQLIKNNQKTLILQGLLMLEGKQVQIRASELKIWRM